MCVYTQTDRQRDIYNRSGVVWWLCCFNSMCIYHHHHYYIMMMIWEYFNSVSHTHGRVHIYAHTHTRHSSVLPATTITTTTTTTTSVCCCCSSSSSGRCARSGLYVYVCVYISCARTRYTTHTHTHIYKPFWLIIMMMMRESVNDPSAGSPTETLLRLLLPLNGKVQSTSPPNGGDLTTRLPGLRRGHGSEDFTGPFNR